MKQINFILGIAGLTLSGLVVFTIACGPHVSQSFALLAATVSLVGCGKLAADQL